MVLVVDCVHARHIGVIKYFRWHICPLSHLQQTLITFEAFPCSKNGVVNKLVRGAHRTCTSEDTKTHCDLDEKLLRARHDSIVHERR